MVGGSDSGQHEDLRRSDGTGRKDDLASCSDRNDTPVAPESDAGGALRLIDELLLDAGVRHDTQVGSPSDTLQEGRVSVPAAATAGRYLWYSKAYPKNMYIFFKPEV